MRVVLGATPFSIISSTSWNDLLITNLLKSRFRLYSRVLFLYKTHRWFHVNAGSSCCYENVNKSLSWCVFSSGNIFIIIIYTSEALRGIITNVYDCAARRSWIKSMHRLYFLSLSSQVSWKPSRTRFFAIYDFNFDLRREVVLFFQRALCLRFENWYNSGWLYNCLTFRLSMNRGRPEKHFFWSVIDIVVRQLRS